MIFLSKRKMSLNQLQNALLSNNKEIIKILNIDKVTPELILLFIGGYENKIISVEFETNNTILSKIINRYTGKESKVEEREEDKHFLIQTHSKLDTKEFDREDLKLAIDCYNYSAFERIIDSLNIKKSDVDYIEIKMKNCLESHFYIGYQQLYTFLLLITKIRPLNIKDLIQYKRYNYPESINFIINQLKLDGSKKNIYKLIGTKLKKDKDLLSDLYNYKYSNNIFWIKYDRYLFYADTFDLLYENLKNFYTNKNLPEKVSSELKNKIRAINALNININFDYREFIIDDKLLEVALKLKIPNKYISS